MDGVWVTYAEAAARLNVSVEAVRQRAIRNKWARTLGNDKRARVRLPDEPYPTQTPVIRPTESALLDALREHIATLKTDIERLERELVAERDRGDLLTAMHDARVTELAGERTARQADHEQHQDQLAAEQAARQADQEHAAARQADQEQQLVAARAASDRATAELVELARRLAAIAEMQASAETAEEEPEPPRRSAVGRAWRWFLRN
jgi:chromosome segregation ATPase